MTKAELFTPQAIERAVIIKRLLQQIQDQAAALRADYVACGGDAMAGQDIYNFADLYAITRTEFQEAMLDLVTTHNAVGLSTIMSGNAYNKVMKLANGRA